MRFGRQGFPGWFVFVLSATPLIGQTPEAIPAAPPPVEARMPPRSLPTAYGTSKVSYIEIPAEEFVPYSSACPWTTDSGRWSSGIGCPFYAGVHLPGGAKVVYLELDYYDNNTSSSVIGSLIECDYIGLNCVSHPTAGAGPADCINFFPGYICSGNAYHPGYASAGADLTSENITVDNFTGSYRLLANPLATDGSLRIAGMFVGYVLQVSPNPGYATFTDVPVDHPFHRYVEALYKAGITGGYPDGRFGVNDTITRGQMAVFLSVALGLEWP